MSARVSACRTGNKVQFDVEALGEDPRNTVRWGSTSPAMRGMGFIAAFAKFLWPHVII